MGFQSVFRPGLFANQVVLVTGGGSGIGRCIAHELASLGAQVVISGRNPEKLDKVRAEIQEDGGLCQSIVCDIREEDQVQAMIKAIVGTFGRLDGLVNNAGGQFPSPLESLSKKGFDAVIRNNLTGTFLVTREALNQAMKHTGGAIVCILVDMTRGFPGMGHTGAARAGVANLVMTGAVEWAQYNVRINAVLPGTIISSGLETYGPAVREHLGEASQRVPMKRLGTESEISGAVCFLLSPASAYITGAMLKIDGGSSLWGDKWLIEDHKKSQPFVGFHRAYRPSWLPE